MGVALQTLRLTALMLAILFFAPLVNAQQITKINFPANNVIYDPYDGMLYASVSGSAGANGNSIVPINPVTGAIGAPVFVGSEPNRMAISDDGHYLYVGLDGAGSVRRFNLLTHQAEIQVSLGLSPVCGGPAIAGDLRVMPGNPHALAELKCNAGC